jgi:succinylarginine dihydrolase
MTLAADTALSLLRESRDAGRIWADNGRTVAALAHTAGVRVTYAHVNLATGATEYRTVGKTREEKNNGN